MATRPFSGGDPLGSAPLPHRRRPAPHKWSGLWRVVGIVAASVVSLAFQPLFWLVYFIWEADAKQPTKRRRSHPPFRIVRPFGVNLIAPATPASEADSGAVVYEWAEILVDSPVVRHGREVCIARCRCRVQGAARTREKTFRIPASWPAEKVRLRLGRACGIGPDVEILVKRA